jgi:hypothetical protein
LKKIKDLFKFPICTRSNRRNFIELWIENPLHTWWKARKYFKFPSIRFSVFSNPIYNCPYARTDYIGKLLDINFHDIQWKDKFDSPRHEMNPHIWVCFFHKFGFSINFVIEYLDELGNKQSGDTFYWEYLLDYLYYSKNLLNIPSWSYQSKIYYQWDHDKHEAIKAEGNIPTALFSLNKRGLKKLQELTKN